MSAQEFTKARISGKSSTFRMLESPSKALQKLPASVLRLILPAQRLTSPTLPGTSPKSRRSGPMTTGHCWPSKGQPQTGRNKARRSFDWEGLVNSFRRIIDKLVFVVPIDRHRKVEQV